METKGEVHFDGTKKTTKKFHVKNITRRNDFVTIKIRFSSDSASFQSRSSMPRVISTDDNFFCDKYNTRNGKKKGKTKKRKKRFQFDDIKIPGWRRKKLRKKRKLENFH